MENQAIGHTQDDGAEAHPMLTEAYPTLTEAYPMGVRA